MADKARENRAGGRETQRQMAQTFPVELDQLVHGRIRLGILSALAAGGTLAFTDLKTLLDTSDGNLSVHARKLEEAGYLDCIKSFEDRTPKTEYRLTEAGRTALEQYLDQMEQVIRMARPS